jgi:peptidoglycan/LPS O-acetylase OafA/YrhL
MINFVQARNYRNDIDGLRAIAVLAVIVFHFGYLPNGSLGVDVFFVISGYLITGIIFNELSENRFSILNFYHRRTRRIIPLALFISLVALSVGIATMLPDDLENIAQSVIATNLFSNNILQAITTRNYWDVVNEYKPLMHTWSLGIEEQYYLFYPLLFLFIGKKRHAWLLPLLISLTIVSLVLFFSSYKEFEKFYLIPFRFYELSIGGLAAIVLKKKLLVHKFSSLLVLLLILLLCFNFRFVPHELALMITVLLTLGILVTANEKSKLASFILENKLMVTVGTISFSLYMWHQVLLSFARYFLFQELHATHLTAIFILTILLSAISYRLIEQPFRDKNRIKNRNLLLILSVVSVLTNTSAFYIYLKAGVLKDIPELDVSKSQTVRNMHATYNSRIYDYDKDFTSSTETLKVLVIGNSFARDWVNVLLESKYKNNLDISYIYDPSNHKALMDRIEKSNIVFYSTPSLHDLRELGIEETKLWAIGTKNFGTNNGIFYNYKGDDYYKQRTLMEKGYLDQNNILRIEWGDKYIDYIGKVIDQNLTVPVFTPSHKFISQDCRHFTKAGAQYFAQLFENELTSIFNNAKSHRMR